MIIAEIGLAHEGSLGIAHSYIDALSSSGVDVVKFQTHIAEAESSKYEKFRVKFSYKDKTRFDYWKRTEFSIDEWAELKKHVEEKNMEFMSTATCVESFDLLEKIGVKRYKVGSGDTNNYLLLEKISSTGKPIIISNGMTSEKDLDKTISFLKNKKNNISLLQCYTSYPTLPQQWGLNEISLLKDKYNIPIGYSDHSGNIYSSLAATALGAEIIEFHVCFDKEIFGPDTKSSITINQVKSLVVGIKEIKESLSVGSINKKDKKLKSIKDIFSKSLALKRDLKKGDKLSIDDLESKKPANMGISAEKFKNLLGKHLKRDMLKGEFLNLKDIK
tara:strand:+ start:118 stop:1110 length:993 start_codon:yes stop_codon:yes gene_type:complete